MLSSLRDWHMKKITFFGMAELHSIKCRNVHLRASKDFGRTIIRNGRVIILSSYIRGPYVGRQYDNSQENMNIVKMGTLCRLCFMRPMRPIKFCPWKKLMAYQSPSRFQTLVNLTQVLLLCQNLLDMFIIFISDPTSLAEDFENEALLPQNIPEELVWYQDKVRRRLQLLEFLERSSWGIEVKSNFFIYFLLLV